MDLGNLGCVVVPLDRSDDAYEALDAALSLVERDKIRLLNVLKTYGPEDDEFIWGSIDDDKRVSKVSARIESELQARGVDPMPIEVRFGAPVDVICRYAKEVKADLVVVGSHGRTGIRRLLMGSVAEGVVRHAPCAVLMVRGNAGQ